MGALTVLVVAALFVGALWVLQRTLIYFPDTTPPDLGPYSTAWEAVSYPTVDGLTLAAWYHPPPPGRPVVIVFSGNAGNRGDRIPLGADLVAAGNLGVLITDYRGYGGNPGSATATGLAADARAALDFVTTRQPGSAVIFFGESLGAAVAIELAVTAPPAALILRSPFTSLAAVGRVHYPWLPVGMLLKDRYPSLDRIGSVAAPTLVIAGDADSIIPFAQSREIFEAAPGPKEFVAVPGADHNDPALVAGRAVVTAVIDFITAAVE